MGQFRHLRRRRGGRLEHRGATGANIFNLGILFFADIVYDGPPLLSEAGRFEIAAALLGLLLTGILLIGLLEQRNRSLFRLGLDSSAILLVYVVGIGLLYTIS